MARSLHQRRTHAVYQDGCYGCQVSTISVASSPDVKDIDRRERVLSKDMEAYKRLRMSGLQPQNLAGSARLEKEARSPIEVEHPAIAGMADEAREIIGEATTFNPTIPASIARHAAGTAQ